MYTTTDKERKNTEGLPPFFKQYTKQRGARKRDSTSLPFHSSPLFHVAILLLLPSPIPTNSNPSSNISLFQCKEASLPTVGYVRVRGVFPSQQRNRKGRGKDSTVEFHNGCGKVPRGSESWRATLPGAHLPSMQLTGESKGCKGSVAVQ